MRRGAPGFTLIEVIVAAAVVVIVVTAYLQMAAVQSDVAFEESQETEAQEGVLRTFSTVIPYLREARYLSTQTMGTPTNTVIFQVPVRAQVSTVGPDGQVRLESQPVMRFDPVKHQMVFQYGSGENVTYANGTYALRFVPGNTPDDQVIEAQIPRSTGVLGVDLNNDGDTLDVYNFGHLELATYDSNGLRQETRQLSGRVCVPVGGGMFVANTATLDVTLMFCDVRIEGERSRLNQIRTTIGIRN
jgi:prepilin-type N-terminal cleavage/methylation domain-containing protein